MDNCEETTAEQDLRPMKDDADMVSDGTPDDVRWARFFNDFYTSLRDGGLEIYDIAKVKHPDADLVLPMYRSCLVIFGVLYNNEVPGDVHVIAYHDPGWMGEERTEESLDRYREDFHFNGQRSSVDVYKAWSHSVEGVSPVDLTNQMAVVSCKHDDCWSNKRGHCQSGHVDLNKKGKCDSWEHMGKHMAFDKKHPWWPKIRHWWHRRRLVKWFDDRRWKRTVARWRKEQ